MNRVVLAVFTCVSLMCIICLGRLSFPVKASGTIFIKGDGSVEPITAPISTLDNVTYTFTDVIHAEIVVERDNARACRIMSYGGGMVGADVITRVVTFCQNTELVCSEIYFLKREKA
ncbi:MAG: hypothetical protein NWE78_04630 [Candidatus Bathyarchaeota archaeon]|nr:hypothetical protein [Candidatus Bathyarchaeota archaeon]